MAASLLIAAVIFFYLLASQDARLIDSPEHSEVARHKVIQPLDGTDTGSLSAGKDKLLMNTGVIHAGPSTTRIGCDGLAEKPLREIPAGGIVKWTDEQGITHYEDYRGSAAPAEMQLVTRFPDTKEYFSLNIETASGMLPASFKSKISEKAIWIYEYYRTLLDERYLSRADVHLVVHNNRGEYEVVRNQYVGEKSEDVPGFYIVTGNRAEILHEGNDEQTLKVMVHEVVHVINNQLFGPLPRWLNEGLATYVESLDRDQQRPASSGERLRFIKKQVGLPLLENTSVRQLLATEKEIWTLQGRRVYYPLSQLLVTYLLQPENSEFSQPFLHELAAQKCGGMDVFDYIETHYRRGITGLDANFRHWLRENGSVAEQ